VPEPSLRPSDVSERRILRGATLLALNAAANGSPAARVDVAPLAVVLKASLEDVMVQLFVLEGLGLASDVDGTGARITARGVLQAERLMTAESAGQGFSDLT
jgi:hypothetical protein